MLKLDVPIGQKFDCAFVLDCDGTAPRVASRMEPIEQARERILIDHHRTSTPIFNINWLDPTKPATAQMIYELLVALPLPITPEMATGLLTGLSCDTGHFRFPNTTPDCLRAAAHLIELGADNALVAFKQFDERSFSSNKLLGVAMQKSQSDHDGELIYTAIASRDFQSQGAGDESSENIVNFLRNVRGARMAICLRERRDELWPTRPYLGSHGRTPCAPICFAQNLAAAATRRRRAVGKAANSRRLSNELSNARTVG